MVNKTKFGIIAAMAIIVCSLASCTKVNPEEPVIPETYEEAVTAVNYGVAIQVVAPKEITETEVSFLDANGVIITSRMLTADKWESGPEQVEVKSTTLPAYLYSPDATGDGIVPLPKSSIETKADGPSYVTLILEKK